MEPQENIKKPEIGVLFEDLIQQANQYTYGAHPGGRMPGNKKLTVLDLLRIGSEDDDKAPMLLPHSMTTFIESLGDIYVQIVETQRMVSSAYNSEISKDTNKIKSSLVKINKNLQKQKELIKDCGNIIDKLR
jgi:hypothetical protein